MKKNCVRIILLLFLVLLTGCKKECKYDEWYIYQMPTCYSDGIEQRKCTDCGKVETRKISKINHEYNDKKIEPTCNEQGYTLHTCIYCEYSYKDNYMELAEHELGDWQVIKNATCTEEGTEERKCNNCDFIESKIISIKHNFEVTIEEPTCESYGWTIHTCVDCGYKLFENSVAALGHKYIDGKCENCGEKRISEGLIYSFNSLEQNYSVYGIGNCTDVEIIIPEEYNGYPIAKIASNAFINNQNIVSVTISKNIYDVASTAFEGCTNLIELIIENREDASIMNCNLNNCVKDTNIKTLYIDVTFDKYCENNYVGSFDKSIVNNFFIKNNNNEYYNLLDESYIEISPNTTKIDKYALAYLNKLKEIVIPNSVIDFGYSTLVFDCNSLEKISAPIHVLEQISSTVAENIKYVTISGGDLNSGTLNYFTQIETVDILNNTSIIKEEAFKKCTNLVNISFGSSIKNIECDVFSECKNLTNVIYYGTVNDWINIQFGKNSYTTIYNPMLIAKNIQMLNENYELSKVKNIVLPKSITSISGDRFYNFNDLESVYYEGNLSDWMKISFDSNYSNPVYITNMA